MKRRSACVGDPPNRAETRVAIAVLFGHTSKEIARELRMALRTVHGHRCRLYAKFGAEGAGQLAAILTGTAEQLPAWLMPEQEPAE